MLKPYYEDESGILIAANFAKVPLSANSVDLVVTSPPYDGIRDYEGYDFSIDKMIDALYKAMKQGAICVWIVADQTIKGSETGNSFRQALKFLEKGFFLHDTMIYGKRGFGNPGVNRYHSVFEYMFIFSKGKPKTVNLIKDKPNKTAGQPAHWGKNTTRDKDGTLKERRGSERTAEYGYRYNIWYYYTGKQHSAVDSEAFLHPAIFPEHLVHDHLLSWSNEGEVVLDPMVGSGTTVKVAKAMNRNFIGVDTSEKYLDECCIPRLKRTKTGDINAIHFQKKSPAIP